MKKESISISPISGQDQAKTSSSSTGDSVSSDNRNTKKGQNYAFAGEQQEGITANTTNTSDLKVNPLFTEQMNTQT